MLLANASSILTSDQCVVSGLLTITSDDFVNIVYMHGSGSDRCMLIQ